jgi:hypothetical protein
MIIVLCSVIAWLVFGLMFRAAGFGWRAGWLFAALMAAGLGASAAFYLN